jgi:hypothetical protein
VIKLFSVKKVSIICHACISYFSWFCLTRFSRVTSRVSLDTVRPLPMFMGVTGQGLCFAPDAFTPPAKKLDKSTHEKIKTRMKMNFAFFLSNYAVVAALVAIVVALMHPGMLFSLGIVWALWTAHTYLISNELVLYGFNIGGLVSINRRSNALMVLTALVTVWKCLSPVIIFFAISGLIILSHAIMRDPSKVIDTDNAFKHDDSDESGTSDSEVMVERPAVRSDKV